MVEFERRQVGHRRRRARLGARAAALLLALGALTPVAAARLARERGVVSAAQNENRLIREKSPYLLQHAHNPVDWYPWGDEAFEKARREDKPVFLSVGYSTCHWCHVMERESFENDSIAEAMNRWFVAIKVDREERPDVDRVYMNAAFAMTGAGGWPLSVFLTPEGKPFYAGTYFPPESRWGRSGFSEVLRSVHEAWSGRREQVVASADQLAQAITEAMRLAPPAVGAADGESLATAAMTGARQQLEQAFDARHGGFGRAPKFPQPSYLLFLFREWGARGDAGARDMALATLERMAAGGMHDALGGGFHRYSTDAEWRVPHFEKMLYDQAQLVMAYLEAYQITGGSRFADVARDVLAYVARDLTHPGGGFFSAEDADSRAPDGSQEEGAFYVWTAAEVEQVLGKEHAAAFAQHYGVGADSGGLEPGQGVLHAARPLEETAAELGLAPEALAGRLAADRARLFEARSRRPRPHLDDKVLTSWNGLMISAFARAYQVLGEPRDLERARRAADFVWGHAWDERAGALHRRFRDGESGVAGELSDYAFLTQGLVDLYEAGFDVRDLERALTLADRQVALFWHEEHGGFFDTAAGADPRLFVRTKEAHDGAEPSGNSVAALALARLARLTGRADLEEKARRTLAAFAARAGGSPLALTQMWVAARFLEGAPLQIVIAGRPDAADTRALLAEARSRFLPGKVLLLADGGAGQEWLARRQEFLRAVAPVKGKAAAYLCEDFTCKLPIESRGQLGEQLASVRPAGHRP